MLQAGRPSFETRASPAPQRRRSGIGSASRIIASYAALAVACRTAGRHYRPDRRNLRRRRFSTVPSKWSSIIRRSIVNEYLERQARHVRGAPVEPSFFTPSRHSTSP